MKTGRAEGMVFLLEIGTEEIPARMVGGAVGDLGDRLGEELTKAGLPPRQIDRFATPRRLAVILRGLLARQPDEEVEVTGAPVRVAFDAAGRPTPAAEGFARAQGVPVGDLLRIPTPKGECVGVRRVVAGRALDQILAERIPPLVESLSFPKTMRWGTGEHRFVRPVHSMVALLDDTVVDMTVVGVRAGRSTFGHRFSGQESIPLAHADDYLDQLRGNGVLADVEERRSVIAEGLLAAARAAGGRIAPPPGASRESDAQGDPELLEEVTHLVEWPSVITGRFDAAFLELPSEILVTAMRHHQKYFSLLDSSGRLLDRFLAVVNCSADHAGTIRRGHEWVLRARLTDARFFFAEDRKTRLEARSVQLERVTFQEKLGSYAQKAARSASLAGILAGAFEEAGLRPDAAAATRASALCKNDLTTQMVTEFPELEGMVGGLYAAADGLHRTVSDAIYGHYLPRGARDPLPSTPEGAIAGLADRLDSQAGIFLLGIVPTGSRDPYALRRSVQGVCRILIEMKIRMSLTVLLGAALDGYADQTIPDAVPRARALTTLIDFYRGRQQYLGEESGLRGDSVRAALAAGSDDPCDARLRMQALEAIRSDPAFESLVHAYKRIKNILHGAPATRLDPARLSEKAEKSLHRELEKTAPSIASAQRARDHGAALRLIGRLSPTLDHFFEKVMVMVEDRAVRHNRLALLQELAALFLKVGDFSEIVLEGESVAPVRRARD